MNGFTFRPAVRELTPIIIGLAGPSKSGKTNSAHRLAVGLAKGGKVLMINTEGPKGHQYADIFKYFTVDLDEPFSTKRYTEAIQEASKSSPAVLIIDSMSHAHEGIGGMLDQHESELDKMAGDDYQKRQRMTWAAWVKPKSDEAIMINKILQMKCHIILCFRAKEKIKIVKGKDPVELGWQPIASDRIHFETAFTLILPPHSEGTPDLKASEFRSPYNTMIKPEQLNEDLGKRLDEWATGRTSKNQPPPPELDWAGYLKKVTQAKEFIGEEKYYKILEICKVSHANEIKTLQGIKDAYAMMVVEFHKVEK